MGLNALRTTDLVHATADATETAEERRATVMRSLRDGWMMHNRLLPNSASLIIGDHRLARHGGAIAKACTRYTAEQLLPPPSTRSPTAAAYAAYGRG